MNALTTLAGYWIISSSILTFACVVGFFLQRRYYQQFVLALRETKDRSEEELWELEQNQDQLRAVFQGMREPIILMRKSGEVLLVNPAFENSFGVQLETAKGKGLLEVVRNKDLYSVLRRCLDERQDQNAQFEIPGQEPRFFDVRAVHLSGKDKEASALAVLHDITALQRAEAVRRDFVANVSHELRTPLGAITGSVETLLDGALQDEKAAKEFLEIIHNNAQQLSELIDQLLDLAKIESQGLDWKWEQVNLCKIVQESRMVFQLRLAAKRIEFESNVPEDMNVRADKNRLRQVLNNLLDNAIKFNREAGRIVVSAAANERAVEVSVEDTGKGIPAESLSRVFERFYRVEKDRNRQAESGAGLGLSIVRHIVEKHGGRVWVESQLERGSTFKFTLPSAASV